jgi:hypothetical protein
LASNFEEDGKMQICNFESLNNLTLEQAKASIRKVIRAATGVSQHERYFNTTRKTSLADSRMFTLLDTVSGSGWAMNRNRQCTHIIEGIKTGKITREELNNFWETVDALPDIELRDLPNASTEIIRQIEMSFDEIRKTLHKWDSSSGTLCFLTKVILMFNWGQSPAFDTRIRAILKVKDVTNKELVIALIEIGSWIRSFESKFGIRIDKLVADELSMQRRMNLKSPPLGRCFDMMLYFQ